MAEPTKTFWQRHPGFDVYSLFWLVLFLILAALGRFYLPLFLPAAVVLVYLLIRLFSKNQQKRQVENARFIALFRSIFRWFRGRKVLQTDKEYKKEDIVVFYDGEIGREEQNIEAYTEGSFLPVLRLSV